MEDIQLFKTVKVMMMYLSHFSFQDFLFPIITILLEASSLRNVSEETKLIFYTTFTFLYNTQMLTYTMLYKIINYIEQNEIVVLI